MYYVYILQCKDESLYTGIATDVERRFKEHRDGIGARYTRAHQPEKIIYREEAATRSGALKREAQIKALSREKKLDLIARSLTVPKAYLPTVPRRSSSPKNRG